MGFRLLSCLLVAWVFVMSGCGVETVDVYALPPPNIYNVSLSPQFEPTGLTVTWLTDQLATTRLDYTTPGTVTNTSWGSNSALMSVVFTFLGVAGHGGDPRRSPTSLTERWSRGDAQR